MTLPALKITLPVGVPPAPVTVAVKVTASVRLEGLALEEIDTWLLEFPGCGNANVMEATGLAA
jgi:hypothetical protein